jgi:hypothetical protein
MDAMKELGTVVSAAATTAPDLLRAAKQALDDKHVRCPGTEFCYTAWHVTLAWPRVLQVAMEEAKAAFSQAKNERDAYKVSISI